MAFVAGFNIVWLILSERRDIYRIAGENEGCYIAEFGAFPRFPCVQLRSKGEYVTDKAYRGLGSVVRKLSWCWGRRLTKVWDVTRGTVIGILRRREYEREGGCWG